MPHDDLSAAKGIIIGLMVCSVFWVAVIVFS